MYYVLLHHTCLIMYVLFKDLLKLIVLHAVRVYMT